MPVVSVVIPCYNYGKYIHECIESIFKQTCKDYEIIVVNDGSTEKFTIDILKGLRDPRITVIHTENRGLASARNTGIENATGKYILPLDADDKIGEEYLTEAVAVLESDPGVGIVYCEAEKFGDVTGKWELPPYSLEAILVSNIIFCSALFRKEDWERVGGYDPEMRHGWEDYDFWLSLIERGVKVHKLDKTLFFYRTAGASSMAGSLSVDKKVEAYRKIFNKHYDLYRRNIGSIFEKIMYLEDRFLSATRVYEDQIATLQTGLREATDAYEAQIAHLEDEKRGIHKGYQAVIDSIHADNSRLSGELVQAHGENNRLLTAYNTMCEECGSLRNDVAELSARNDELAQTVAMLQSEAGRLQQMLLIHQKSISFNAGRLFSLIVQRIRTYSCYLVNIARNSMKRILWTGKER